MASMPATTGDREDPVAALGGLLDRLDRHIAAAGVAAGRDERNRLSLLSVHGAVGVVLAPLFTQVMTTGPSWTVLRHVPGAPDSLAALVGVGGLVLVTATAVRSLRWETVGLVMMIAWYAVMASGFAAAIGVWIAHGRPAATSPALYTPVVYAHVAVVLSVHLRTLYRIRTGRR